MGIFSKLFGNESKNDIYQDESAKIILDASIKAMSYSLLTAYPIMKLSKKITKTSNDNKTAKERYLLAICFLFGFNDMTLQKMIDDRNDQLAEYMQFIIHLFHGSTPDNLKKTFFSGIDFKPHVDGGYSQQNVNALNWYLKKRITPNKKDSFHKVKITGAHLSMLTLLKKTSPEQKKMLTAMGTYIKNEKQPLWALSEIFRDKKTKFKF